MLRERYQLRLMMRPGWGQTGRTLTMVEQLPRDVSRLLCNARRGWLCVSQQTDRELNRFTAALGVARLIIGSSFVMAVPGSSTPFCLPVCGFLGFASAFVVGVWRVRPVSRSSRRCDLGLDLDNGD